MQIANVENEIQQLEMHGYLNIPSAFDRAQIEEVSNEVSSILANEMGSNAPYAETSTGPFRNYEQRAYANSTGTISSSFLGKSPILDSLAVSLFSDKVSLDFYRRIVGKNLRIYTFSIR